MPLPPAAAAPPPPPAAATAAALKKCLVFVDVEATGPSLLDHFVPCFGVAVIACGGNTEEEPPRLLHSRKWFVRPPLPSGPGARPRTWSEATLRDFWRKPHAVAMYECITRALSHGAAVTPQQAVREFVEVCRAAARDAPGGGCVLCADTSGFDFCWLSYYLSHYGPPECPSPNLVFGAYRGTRDVSSFFAGMGLALPSLGGGDVGSSEAARYPHREAMRRLGLDEATWQAFARGAGVPGYCHNPEVDAIHVGMRSGWIMWHAQRLHAERWRVAVLARTDLRGGKPGRAAALGAHAVVGALTRASVEEARRWQVLGAPRSSYECSDAATLFRVRDAARACGANHHLQCCDRNNVPAALAVGPAPAAVLERLLGALFVAPPPVSQ